MTTLFIELETINDQELQAAAGGGKGLKTGKGPRTKKTKPTPGFAQEVGKTVAHGAAFEAGGLIVDHIANAITPSDAE